MNKGGIKMKIWLKKLKDFFKGVSKHPRFINVLSLIMYYYSRWVGKTTRWDIFGVNQLYQVWHQEKPSFWSSGTDGQ